MAHGLSSLPGTYSRALGRTRWAYHLQGQLSSIFLVPDGNVVARTSCRRQEIIIYQLVTCESIAVPVLHRPVAHRMNMSSSSVPLSVRGLERDS